MQGAFSFACLNKSRTLDAPIPTNISTNSEPDMEKKGTLDSPATAFARRVLPVPGGPTSRMPFGIEAPISLYLFGLCRYSTISVRFSFASSSPATSENLIPSDDLIYTFALDFPMPKIMEFPPFLPIIFLDIYCPSATNRKIGKIHVKSTLTSGDICCTISLENFAPESYSRCVLSGSSIKPVL